MAANVTAIPANSAAARSAGNNSAVVPESRVLAAKHEKLPTSSAATTATAGQLVGDFGSGGTERVRRGNLANVLR